MDYNDPQKSFIPRAFDKQMWDSKFFLCPGFVFTTSSLQAHTHKETHIWDFVTYSYYRVYAIKTIG